MFVALLQPAHLGTWPAGGAPSGRRAEPRSPLLVDGDVALRPLRALLLRRRGATLFGADSSAVAAKLGSGIRTIVTTKRDATIDVLSMYVWGSDGGTLGGAFAAIFDDGSAVSSLMTPALYTTHTRSGSIVAVHITRHVTRMPPAARCRHHAHPSEVPAWRSARNAGLQLLITDKMCSIWCVGCMGAGQDGR